jgi:hypothetical protein
MQDQGRGDALEKDIKQQERHTIKEDFELGSLFAFQSLKLKTCRGISKDYILSSRKAHRRRGVEGGVSLIVMNNRLRVALEIILQPAINISSV